MIETDVLAFLHRLRLALLLRPPVAKLTRRFFHRYDYFPVQKSLQAPRLEGFLSREMLSPVLFCSILCSSHHIGARNSLHPINSDVTQLVSQGSCHTSYTAKRCSALVRTTSNHFPAKMSCTTDSSQMSPRTDLNRGSSRTRRNDFQFPAKANSSRQRTWSSRCCRSRYSMKLLPIKPAPPVINRFIAPFLSFFCSGLHSNNDVWFQKTTLSLYLE